MKKTFKLAALISFTTLVTSCVAPQPFTPKPLNEKAKGIATTRTTPYGCKVLGEIEGKDEADVYSSGNTLLAVREGANNDLRNNAIEVVGNSKKRTVLKITSEQAMCFRGEICKDQTQERQPVTAYYMKADVFECGDK